MSPLRLALPLLALAALTACVVPVVLPAPNGAPGAIMVDEGDSCGARGLQGFVGQSAAAVEGTTFQSPGPVRILRPGEAATADANPQRVNFRTDASGTVVAVDCG